METNMPSTDEQERYTKWNGPITVLGKVFYPPLDVVDFMADLRSHLFCSYRRKFLPIGDYAGPTADQGWGCMHRCGQMMIAQALINVHLGRDWLWSASEYHPVYARIENLFHDIRTASYSIHQLTNMGMAEGKEIGDWFGPNTIAQVLKKLSVYEDWTKLVVHVAMEDGIIVDEIREKCYTNVPLTTSSALLDSFVKLGSSSPRHSFSSRTPPQSEQGKQSFCDLSEVEMFHRKILPSKESGRDTRAWRPLLLIIPLRVGLKSSNVRFLPALKKCLDLKQSVGILGGWPKHALWIIGHNQDELLYFDPHVTQKAASRSATSCELESDLDENRTLSYPSATSTYHTARVGRLRMSHLDPSLAVGFVCDSERSFLELVELLCREVNHHAAGEPLFEVHPTRPQGLTMTHSMAEKVFQFTNSDSDFEMI